MIQDDLGLGQRVGVLKLNLCVVAGVPLSLSGQDFPLCLVVGLCQVVGLEKNWGEDCLFERHSQH